MIFYYQSFRKAPPFIRMRTVRTSSEFSAKGKKRITILRIGFGSMGLSDGLPADHDGKAGGKMTKGD